MDVRRLLKVYNVVNDEKRHKLNVKFAAALAALLLSGAALVAFFVWEPAIQAEAPRDAADPQTECVMLTPEQIAAGADPAELAAMRSQWERAHPDREIISQEPVHRNGVPVGHCFTYRDA